MTTVSLDCTTAEKFSLAKSFGWRDSQINCTLAVAQPPTDTEIAALPGDVGRTLVGLRVTRPLRAADHPPCRRRERAGQPNQQAKAT